MPRFGMFPHTTFFLRECMAWYGQGMLDELDGIDSMSHALSFPVG